MQVVAILFKEAFLTTDTGSHGERRAFTKQMPKKQDLTFRVNSINDYNTECHGIRYTFPVSPWWKKDKCICPCFTQPVCFPVFGFQI